MLICWVGRCRVGSCGVNCCRVAISGIGLRSLTEVGGELALFPSSWPVAVSGSMCRPFLGLAIRIRTSLVRSDS